MGRAWSSMCPPHLHSPSPGVAPERHRPWLPPLLHVPVLPAGRALHGLRLVWGWVQAPLRVHRHLGPGQLPTRPHRRRSALPSPCSSHLPSSRMGRDVANGVANGGGTPFFGWVLCPSEKGISGLATVTGLWGLGVTQVPLPQFHPRSAPLRGRTRVTLCGMTFRSRSDLGPSHSPAGAYQVAVGRRGCTVLPEESESYRCAAVLGGNSSREGSGAAPRPGADPPSLSCRPLPTSRRKEFVDMLVCELEPGGPAAVGGPADVVLTVKEPTRPFGFRVYGSATLGGFVFVVWFHTGRAPGRVGGVWLTHPPL